MKLGLNLSFAIKRWLGSNQLAAIMRDEWGFDCVQMTWDIVNPEWPSAVRDTIARDYASAFARAGVTVESTFGGVASYTYNHFLAPTPELRQFGQAHLLQAIDTAAMGVTSTGCPFGAFSAQDALNSARRAEIYKKTLELLVEATRHAGRSELESPLIEPTPLATEFPSSARDAARMMNFPFEEADQIVLNDMKAGAALLRTAR
jgi:hypothetical protein